MNSEKFVYIWLFLSLICVIGTQLVILEVSHASKLCDLKIDRVTPDQGAFTVSNIGTYTNKRTKALIWIKYENGTIYKKFVDIKAILPGKSVYYKNKFVINGPVKNALIRVNPYQTQRELNFNNNAVFFKYTSSILNIENKTLMASENYRYSWKYGLKDYPTLNFTPIVSPPTNRDFIDTVSVCVNLTNKKIDKVILKIKYDPDLDVYIYNGNYNFYYFEWNYLTSTYEMKTPIIANNPTIVVRSQDYNPTDVYSSLTSINFNIGTTIFFYSGGIRSYTYK